MIWLAEGADSVTNSENFNNNKSYVSSTLICQTDSLISVFYYETLTFTKS